MEQSKLVSTVLAKLKIAYPYYFKDLTYEEFIGFANVYQAELGKMIPVVLLKAIKSIIEKNKFMPALAEIIEEYKANLKDFYIEVINKSNPENKKYLLDMIDWYSLSEEFPNNLPADVTNSISHLDYNESKKIENKGVVK